MVNTTKFAKRLQKILDQYDLSAAAFADEIQVGRSSISHILSGRNKPSLDFVMKIASSFPEVELNWLLHGKGDFPQKSEIPTQNDLFSSANAVSSDLPKGKKEFFASSKQNARITKIALFYKDGTFEVFEN